MSSSQGPPPTGIDVPRQDAPPSTPPNEAQQPVTEANPTTATGHSTQADTEAQRDRPTLRDRPKSGSATTGPAYQPDAQIHPPFVGTAYGI
jgi:hypothetical protein